MVCTSLLHQANDHVRAALVCADVSVLMVPRCESLSDALHVGSDACSPKIKSWLAKVSRSTRLNETLDAAFHAFLNDSSRVYNSGVVGGKREAFAPALKAVTARLAAFRRSVSGNATRYKTGADMVLWNWAALEAHARPWRPPAAPATPAGSAARAARAAVITGYPWGPVNYPMWAKLSTGGLCAGSHHGVHGYCNSECGYQWLNRTGLGAYWFGHKLPRSWLNLLRLHACWPQHARTALGLHALRRAGAGRFRCECGRVGAEEQPTVRTQEPTWS